MTGCHPYSSSVFPAGGRGPLMALDPVAFSKVRPCQACSHVKPAHSSWFRRFCSSVSTGGSGELWPPSTSVWPDSVSATSENSGIPERAGHRNSGGEVWGRGSTCPRGPRAAAPSIRAPTHWWWVTWGFVGAGDGHQLRVTAVLDFLQGSSELAGKWGRGDSRGPWGGRREVGRDSSGRALP